MGRRGSAKERESREWLVVFEIKEKETIRLYQRERKERKRFIKAPSLLEKKCLECEKVESFVMDSFCFSIV